MLSAARQAPDTEMETIEARDATVVTRRLSCVAASISGAFKKPCLVPIEAFQISAAHKDVYPPVSCQTNTPEFFVDVERTACDEILQENATVASCSVLESQSPLWQGALRHPQLVAESPLKARKSFRLAFHHLVGTEGDIPRTHFGFFPSGEDGHFPLAPQDTHLPSANEPRARLKQDSTLTPSPRKNRASHPGKRFVFRPRLQARLAKRYRTAKTASLLGGRGRGGRPARPPQTNVSVIRSPPPLSSAGSTAAAQPCPSPNGSGARDR